MLKRFGIEIESERGALLREGGFLVVDRYDGHTPPGPESGYADWLRTRGYDSADPWSDFVISALDGHRVVSGWNMRNAHLPSRVEEAHSETAYMTDLALDWIRARGSRPWVLHLSYVKPHWPYLAPAPFHKLYRRKDIGPILRGPQDGTADEHPVVRAYREHDECVSFAREDVVRHVRPAYMGLIAQVDYHLGRVLDALESMGRLSDTLIVFTSDHGEFSGDRGLGEKELLYDEIVRVPMIVMDPDARADATRGKADARFVEGIDVLPTIVEALGIPGSPHRVEGRSLLPLLRGEVAEPNGATRCFRSSTTVSAARAACWAVACAIAARSWCARASGSTCIGRAFGHSSSISPPIRTSRSISAPIRGSRRYAWGCASGCSTGSPRASGARRSTMRWSRRAPTPIARTGSTSASGDDGIGYPVSPRRRPLPRPFRGRRVEQALRRF